MAKKPRFAGLTTNLAPKPAPADVTAPAAASAERSPPPKAKAREGKKAIVGYFSGEMSRELRMLSITEGTTVQALLGEAVDMLLRDRGKHPFGER